MTEKKRANSFRIGKVRSLTHIFVKELDYRIGLSGVVFHLSEADARIQKNNKKSFVNRLEVLDLRDLVLSVKVKASS